MQSRPNKNKEKARKQKSSKKVRIKDKIDSTKTLRACDLLILYKQQ